MAASTSTSTATPKPTIGRVPLRLPLVYRLFFLVIEPISALVGAYYAYRRPDAYLAMTEDPWLSSASSSLPPAPATTVVLAQLANLYLLFAVNEALVLRATADRRVWRALLLGLLVADLGHLWALRPLGAAVYYRVDRWNAMAWGNVPFVYAGAALRVAFLAGVGLGRTTAKTA